MKYLINIFLTQLIVFTSFAQGNFEKYNVNVEFISESSVSNGDGGVKLFYTSQAENNYKFKILARVTRNEKGKSDQYAEVTYLKLSYVTNGNTSLIADNLILNFIPDGQTQSGYKEFSIEIPSTIQTDGKIIGEFYTKNNSTSIKEIKAINTPLIAKVLLGPSQVCSEGIFSFGGPETVILENATGIATLTSLGNNQWKVTRIGSALGTVYLKSTSGTKIYNYPINVSSNMKGAITGVGGIKQGMTGTITFTPLAGTNYTNLVWTVDAGAHTSLQIDPYNLKITIPPNYPLYDTYNGDDVIVTVKGNGECGLMEKHYVLRILPRQPSPPQTAK